MDDRKSKASLLGSRECEQYIGGRSVVILQ